MKLFTKISLIVAAVALGLGILGIVIGIGMGADAGDLSEMGIYISPYHQVRVISAITEVEEETREGAIEEKFYVYEDKSLEHRENGNEHDHANGDGNVYHSYSVVTEDIKRLEVDVRNAEIYIFSTAEEQLRFDSNRENEIGRVEGNTLKLEEENFREEPLVLEVYIPEGLLKEIDIEAAAGTVTADRILADSVSIEVDAANVQIVELQVTKDAELHVEAGKIVVEYYDGPELDVECTAGAITVVCEGNEFDYNYEMECGMGKIVYGQESYSLVGEKIRRSNKRSKKIEAECGMGEIRFEFPNSL